MTVSRQLPILLIVTIAVFSAGSATSHADSSDILKKLLVPVKGWNAADAEGANIDMGGVKMITAFRTYSANDGEQGFTAMLIVGTNALMQGKLEDVDFDSDEGEVTVSTIDKFKVAKAHNKETREGHIIVNLVTGEAEGSMFLLHYTGITSETAFEIAKKYTWKKLKTETEKLLRRSDRDDGSSECAL